MSNSIEKRWGTSKKYAAGIIMLLDAFEYSNDVASSTWDFAVEIRRLCDLGLNETDFRWLVKRGYVEHARETTLLGQNERKFQPSGNLSFFENSCFVPTSLGVLQLQALLGKDNQHQQMMSLGEGNGINSNDHAPCSQSVNRELPNWDADLRKLYFKGEIVKRFKWPAMNQEAVLTVFHEEGWPERIDDPLSPKADQDPKRRLADTIKCLNRKQSKPLIHFRGDGTGEGITWEKCAEIENR